MNKKLLTLNEYIDDCLAKGESKEALEKRLLGELHKEDGIFKPILDFIKPTVPGAVTMSKEEIERCNKLRGETSQLYSRLRYTKKQKDWKGVISICERLIELSTEKFLSIFPPTYYKDMASAYGKLKDIDSALKYYRVSKEGFLECLKITCFPKSILKDIAIIDRRILKLER